MDIKSDDCSQNVGIGRNLNSDDDFDEDDVVIRRHSSRFLLADGGDGSEADLLGTTPPRSRIRNKEIRKNNFDSAVFVQRAAKANRNSDVPRVDPTSGVADRLKKRASLKLFRSRERDWKQDMGQRDQRSESLPSPSSGVAPNLPAVPTLVESCNRFMCLTSRLKSRDSEEQESSQEEVVERRYPPEDEPPASRVTFHKTFSMLINMGNIEKGCRRTISREEQVWQNELKDLIWLELQAKIAGRSLAQQDSYLCAQRDVVPSVLQNIMDYKFVNPSGCRLRSERLSVVKGSQENLTQHPDFEQDTRSKRELYEGDHIGCLSFNCRECTDAIGKAMKEIGALLDSFYNAVALYPSSKAMTVEHPLVATDEFKNRIKAMCLWFNTALHMRLKLLAVRRLVRTLRPRAHSLRKSSTPDSTRLCQVRFNVSDNSNDSYISDSSGQSDSSKDIKESEIRVNGDVDSSGEYVRRQCDAGFRSYVGDRLNADEVKHGVDEVDNFSSFGEISNRTEDPPTPEIVISDKYGSSESGYLSGADSSPVDVFSLGPMADLSRLRLLGKCDVSPYRAYHYEMLKTQGVRRCMTFINKLRKNVLCKVHITLEKPDSPFTERVHEEETSLMFEEPNKTEDSDAELPQEEDLEKTYELRRYGCWSEESLAMRLPSYRNHFLVLSSICMEAVHDYLSLRLESSPERPSCLTVKQLIHELKEGLDISTEMRHDFVRNVEVALRGVAVSPEVRGELLLLLRTYDATVHSVLRQYLGYLRMMSEKEPLGRAWLRAEWAFTARLAARDRPAALLAPAAFAEISCNQISRLLKEFKNKFDSLIELEKSVHHTPNRYTAYVMCRAVQEIYARWREPLLHAAAWARALAAKLTLPRWAPQREAILNSLMSMREFTLRHTEMVLERTRVPDEELELTEGLVTRVRELLLQMFKLGFEIHKELYRVVNDVSGRAPLTSRRSVLNSPPKGLKPKFARSESIGEENVFDDRLFDSFNSVDGHKETIERLLSGEDKESEVGVSGNVEGGPATEGREAWQAKVGRALVQFAHCWMKFVVGRVERGRGLRPRWASQGLEFLMLACEPCNTKHLTDQEFEELKQQMDGCISHVVGSRRETAQAPRTRHRLHSPTPNSPGRVAPPTPPTDTEPPLSFHTKDADHQSRVCEAIYQLDAARDEKLRELKAVGSVVDVAVSSYQPKLKQVTFKWQRGLKIGAGTFGKVYTVVNTESGQVLAMKEVSVGAGDRRALQRAANELQVLEGVLHPHLVRYYGCELHREEMLIFMELCVEGSLEALVATCGGLQEPAARRYTGQLVAAVGELHARGIAHRDIKSGNIFLTNEGHCLKLGDFGCAVKIRANTTAPGELQGFVGTQAYMAPEVFMKSSGHGRAADVWSLGCVVTEMASGKRPFSEYDSNYQIMFVVGMGGRPDIPPSLSEEGRDFCRQCLSHDPDNRPRAETLSLHHFLMVKDDNKCTIGNFVS